MLRTDDLEVVRRLGDGSDIESQKLLAEAQLNESSYLLQPAQLKVGRQPSTASLRTTKRKDKLQQEFDKQLQNSHAGHFTIKPIKDNEFSHTVRKADLERIRNRIGQFVVSLPGEKKLDPEYVMRVKGKALNSFLGFMKTDIARLSVEAFPQEINKQLVSLMLLRRADLCWFDILIEKRIATLRSNFFVGVNAGNRFFKVGFLCLIGIAHLPEAKRDMAYHKRFELRPCTTTDIGAMVEEQLADMPEDVGLVVQNLFHAVKLICTRVLPHVPVSGNVTCQDGMLKAQNIQSFFRGGNDVDVANDMANQTVQTVDESLQVQGLQTSLEYKGVLGGLQDSRISYLNEEDNLGDKLTLSQLYAGETSLTTKRANP